MTSLNLVYRPSVKKGHYPGSLSLRIVHNRRSKTITLPDCQLFDEEWNGHSKTIVYPDDNSLRVARLKEIEQRVRNEITILNGFIARVKKNGRYSVDDIIFRYRERKDESKLLGYGERLANDLEKCDRVRTARAYRTVIRGLVKFNKERDIPLEQINSCLIKEYESYLKKQGRMPNTVSYHMRNLRAIYNKAIKEKRARCRTNEDPFSGVYTGVTKTMKRSLSLEELRRLYKLDLNALIKNSRFGSPKYKQLNNLYTARHYFTFCFHARGMCFIDLAYLRKSDIHDGVIRYARKKTGQQMEMALTSEMKEIISHFSRQTTGSPYVFPIIGDRHKNHRLQYENALRVQNLRLKQLASLAGISKRVSTHVARHSWASIGKQNNIPLSVISECLGHTSERTTQIYLSRLDNSLLNDANERVVSAISYLPVRKVKKNAPRAALVSPH